MGVRKVDNNKIIVDAARFKMNNAIIIRSIAVAFSCKWFKLFEIKALVSNRDIDGNDLREAINYLEGRGYIETRTKDTRSKVLFIDFEPDEIEFKLTSEGKLFMLGEIADAGIDRI
jgi:hypothetical protein